MEHTNEYKTHEPNPDELQKIGSLLINPGPRTINVGEVLIPERTSKRSIREQTLADMHAQDRVLPHDSRLVLEEQQNRRRAAAAELRPFPVEPEDFNTSPAKEGVAAAEPFPVSPEDPHMPGPVIGGHLHE